MRGDIEKMSAVLEECGVEFKKTFGTIRIPFSEKNRAPMELLKTRMEQDEALKALVLDKTMFVNYAIFGGEDKLVYWYIREVVPACSRCVSE